MIRLRELYRLQGIHNLRLIAGDAGLERTVTAAVLFEYDPSRMQLPDFYKGDLVVTTLAYARGEEALVSISWRHFCLTLSFSFTFTALRLCSKFINILFLTLV